MPISLIFEAHDVTHQFQVSRIIELTDEIKELRKRLATQDAKFEAKFEAQASEIEELKAQVKALLQHNQAQAKQIDELQAQVNAPRFPN